MDIWNRFHFPALFLIEKGENPSRELVEGLAKAGNGKAEFIVKTHEIKNKVIKQLKSALQHAITNVAMDWGSLKVVQSPHTIPQIFNGSPCRVYCFIENIQVGFQVENELIVKEINDKISACLVAQEDGEEMKFQLEIDPQLVKAGKLIHTLSARHLIRELEEGFSSFHENGNLKAEYNKIDKFVQNKIQELGIK